MAKFQGKVRTYDEFVKLLGPDVNVAWGHRLKVRLDQKLISFSDAVVCLDAATGKELWRSEFPGIGGDEAGDMGHFGASGTPAVVGDRVYASGSAGVYCLSIKDGSIIWQTKTDYTHSSPLVAHHAVFAVLHEGLVAFDARTGHRLWSLSVGGYGCFGCFANCSSVVEWISGGKSYVVGVANGGLYCVDPDKGTMLWQVPGAKQIEGSSTPAIQGDRVVVYADKGVQAYKISPEKADLLWMAGKRSCRAGSPLIYQDHVYAVTNDMLQCSHLKTGALKWQEKMNGNYCSPIVVDGKIIHNTGHAWYPISTLMFKASPEKFESLGRFPYDPKLGEYQPKRQVATCSSPAVADGKLYLRCGGSALDVEAALGDCVACFDLTEAGNRELVAAQKPRTGAASISPAKPLTATDTAVAKVSREVPTKASTLASAAGAGTGEAPAARTVSTAAPQRPGWTKNWPQFRGPWCDGRAAADADPPTELDLAKDTRFSTPVPARGRSSPIVWGNRIYLTGEDACVMAFDRETGTLQWNTTLKAIKPRPLVANPGAASEPDDGEPPRPSMGGSAGGAAPTPVTDGQFVYAFFGNGTLGCVDAGGKQIWAKALAAGKPKNMYGLAGSPVLYGEVLIQVVDCGGGCDDHGSFVVALRAKDGAEVWRKERPVSSCWTTPAIRARPGRRRAGDDRPAPGDCLRPADRPTTLAGAGLAQPGTLGLDAAVRRGRCGAGRQRGADRAEARRPRRRNEVQAGLDLRGFAAGRGQSGWRRRTGLSP